MVKKYENENKSLLELFSMKKNPVGIGIILLILCFNIKPSFAGRPLSTEDAGVSSKGVFLLR